MEEGFNLAKLEEKTLEFWDEHNVFKKSLEKTEGGKPFTFYDGPPFATGLPHYGHILASTVKDLIPRYETMQNRFVRRRWGWDCHGLPIEEIVERKLGISGKKQIEEVGIKKFNETCRAMVLQYVSEWRSMVRRIARWVDFDNSYKTMDTDYMESVWWAFKQIYDKDLIYEGRKVLLYCPRCETPVSNFEVAMDNSYKDVIEESVFVKFKVRPGQRIGKDFISDDHTYIMAWTTTPWTLPGNVALAVGKDIEYVVAKIGDTHLILAEKRLEILPNKNLGRKFLGKDLIGISYEPLFDVPAAQSDTSFKVYGADFVTTEEGTGIVHTAVVYGEDDYALGIKEGLPIVPLLDEKGKFNEKAPKFLHGLYFKDSEEIIKDTLAERGSLFERKMHTHSYPFCWRCGTPLFYNAIPAWFVNVQKIKPKLLKSNDKEVNWFPGHLKHGRYEKSVEAAPDWNISRNRYWGNPIPVWKCDDCGRGEVAGSLEELSEKAGGSKNQYWGIRHGQSENIIFNIADSGDQNFHLTSLGKDQIKEAAETLKSKKIDLIFASDIARTKESAEIIAEMLGVPVHNDKRLREINMGGLSGKPGTEYSKRFPTQESRFEGKVDAQSESLRDVRARVWDFLRETEKKHHGKNILIVSHEGTLWMLSEVAQGWSEGKAIEAKDKRKGVFADPAEIIQIPFKNIPRNDAGEADMHRPYIDEIVISCKGCNGTMHRTPEIFDSWMEAGSMPFAEYHYPFEHKALFEGRFPAQFVAEYIAQTRAWFYVMHVISEILFGRAPFENVVTTGTILAEDGSKMSKSKGNFPDPNMLIDKYGADSLRFYLMNSVVMQADNLNFSEQAVATIYRKVALIVWNVGNFFTTYTEPAEVALKERAGSENILDRWITVRTNELIDGVTAYLNSYDTVHATRVIQEYVDDLSTWYLRRSRKRKDSGFATTLYKSLASVSTVIAPFMPFLAEELYQKLKPYRGGTGPISIHLVDWPPHRKANQKEKAAEEKLVQDMAEVRRLASLALAKRSEAGIKVRQPLAALKIKNISLSRDLLPLLAEEINVKQVVQDPNLKEEVELDVALTDELREEGLMREIVRMVQGLRQEADLKPKDPIAVMLDLGESARPVAQRNEKFLKGETGAKSVEYKRSDKFTVEQVTKLDGREVWIGIRKI